MRLQESESSAAAPAKEDDSPSLLSSLSPSCTGTKKIPNVNGMDAAQPTSPASFAAEEADGISLREFAGGNKTGGEEEEEGTLPLLPLSLSTPASPPQPHATSPSISLLRTIQFQRVCLFFSHVLSLFSTIIVSHWVFGQMDGVSTDWNKGPDFASKQTFNWHPLLMVTSFFFMTVATLAFRHDKLTQKRDTVKRALASHTTTTTTAAAATANRKQAGRRRSRFKLVHVASWITAALCACIALVAVFKSHNNNAAPIANMYSLHSWVGGSVVLVYMLQFVVGVGTFTGMTWPFPNNRWNTPAFKAAVLRMHSFVGPFIYLSTAFAILLGIQEKEGWIGCSYDLEEVDSILPSIQKIPAICQTSHALAMTVFLVTTLTCFTMYDF